jgi:hypothetical protein
MATIEESVKGINEEFNLLLGRQPDYNTSDTFVGVITDQMVKDFEKAAKPDGPIAKGAEEVGETLADKIVSYPSIEANLKSALIRLTAELKNKAEVIRGDYDQGKIDLTKYYDERAEIVKRKIAAEIAIIQQAISREDDVSKLEILNAKKAAKEQQLVTELVKIENERIKAQDKLNEDQARKEEKLRKEKLKLDDKLNKLRLKAEKAYKDQKERIKQEGVTTLDAKFAKELSDLQTRQNAELEEIKKYHSEVYQAKVDAGADEIELEKAKQAELKAIREQTELQNTEKAQQVADQNLRLQEYKLNNLKMIAEGASDIFNSLYEMSGKKNKELFRLAKAAAIAEATINVAQGVTKALAQGGYWGIAQGIFVAAAGAAQIATIASQRMATGGEVQGHSPTKTADNIPANLTAGEYVHPVDSVRHYGKGMMEAIRNRTFPRSNFAYGGYVTTGRRNFANGGMVSSQPGQTSGGVVINLNNQGLNLEVQSKRSRRDDDKEVIDIVLAYAENDRENFGTNLKNFLNRG